MDDMDGMEEMDSSIGVSIRSRSSIRSISHRRFFSLAPAAPAAYKAAGATCRRDLPARPAGATCRRDLPTRPADATLLDDIPAVAAP
jgi:hypothetical protein